MKYYTNTRLCQLCVNAHFLKQIPNEGNGDSVVWLPYNAISTAISFMLLFLYIIHFMGVIILCNCPCCCVCYCYCYY